MLLSVNLMAHKYSNVYFYILPFILLRIILHQILLQFLCLPLNFMSLSIFSFAQFFFSPLGTITEAQKLSSYCCFPLEIKIIGTGRGKGPHSSNYTPVEYIIWSVYFGCLLKVLLFQPQAYLAAVGHLFPIAIKIKKKQP